MSSQNRQLSLGLLLQNAGLISQEQLQNALDTQAKFTHLKIGEIIQLQEGLKTKTIDFFADKWQENMVQGQQFPLGYYLKDASLLNEQQIKTILKEQRDSQQKFGAIAVKKGWIKQATVDFFLKNLAFKPPQLISLSSLEEYNRHHLHLEEKYANYLLILVRILAWTGGNIILTKNIVQVFASLDLNIPAGSEMKAVDRFIEVSLIGKWQTSETAKYIRNIEHNLIDNSRCDSSLLLQEYLAILFLGNKAYQNTEEQNELLLLGLVAPAGNSLQIANLIYQQIFNQEFITQQLISSIQSKSNSIINLKPDQKIKATTEYTPNLSTKRTVQALSNFEPKIKSEVVEASKNINTTELLTKITLLMTLTAIALSIPLLITINNYYSSLIKQDSKISSNPLLEASELRQFCNEINFANTNSSLNLIFQLEMNQQQLSQVFPDNCAIALNRLRVMVAPQLGRESRILEAIRHLCKIPADSEMYLDAEVWLKRWYNSASWGKETKLYLQELDKYDDTGCPAARFAEYD